MNRSVRKTCFALAAAAALAAACATDTPSTDTSTPAASASGTVSDVRPAPITAKSPSGQRAAAPTGAQPTVKGVPAQRSVYYDYDRFDVKSEYHPSIEAHARYLREHAGARLTIEGNGDERGSREYNVHERRYAIFPQRPGLLPIGPDVFEAIVWPGNGSKRQFRLRPDVVALEVRPAVAPPATHPGAVWLPAADLRIEEVRDAKPHAARLVGVGRPDAAARRPDGSVARLAHLLDDPVIRKDHVGRARDEEPPVDRDPLSQERLALGPERLRVDDDPVSDVADRARAQDSRRDQVQHERLVPDANRVARVRTALVTRHHIGILTQQVDDLSLALVAPLGADDNPYRHD